MNPEELKAYRHDCYMANRQAARVRIMRWRELHPERHKAAVRKSYTAAIADGSYAAACKRWRAAHPEYQESVQEENRLRCQQWGKDHPEAYRQWCLANPDKIAERNWRADARRRDSEGSFTAEEFAALGSRCLRCYRNDVPMTADHVIPVSKGGTSYIRNIQPLCQSCNSSKGSKHIDYRDMYYGA
jgi:5-methylcytosine-specific restriction endonuclease McrA